MTERFMPMGASFSREQMDEFVQMGWAVKEGSDSYRFLPPPSSATKWVRLAESNGASPLQVKVAKKKAKGKSRKPLAVHTVVSIRARHKSGESAPHIAKALGISKVSVYKYLKRNGK